MESADSGSSSAHAETANTPPTAAVTADVTRLTRMGAPDEIARRNDWDQISEPFTAIRGLGYVVWYLAVRDLPATHAATVQLSLPALVALGGVAFLSEPITARLMVASAAMLGGIALVLGRRSEPQTAS